MQSLAIRLRFHIRTRPGQPPTPACPHSGRDGVSQGSPAPAMICAERCHALTRETPRQASRGVSATWCSPSVRPAGQGKRPLEQRQGAIGGKHIYAEESSQREPASSANTCSARVTLECGEAPVPQGKAGGRGDRPAVSAPSWPQTCHRKPRYMPFRISRPALSKRRTSSFAIEVLPAPQVERDDMVCGGAWRAMGPAAPARSQQGGREHTGRPSVAGLAVGTRKPTEHRVGVPTRPRRLASSALLVGEDAGHIRHRPTSHLPTSGHQGSSRRRTVTANEGSRAGSRWGREHLLHLGAGSASPRALRPPCPAIGEHVACPPHCVPDGALNGGWPDRVQREVAGVHAVGPRTDARTPRRAEGASPAGGGRPTVGHDARSRSLSRPSCNPLQ